MTDEGKQSMDVAIEEIRGLSINDRCAALIDMFTMVVGEFEQMVLEHCEATPISPKAKRVAKKLTRRIKRRR